MSVLNAKLGDDGSWDSGLISSVPVRGQLEEQLEQLKQKLLKPILKTASNSDLIRELCWAANEAAALAWFTICPILVLPMLLEEKVGAAWKKWEKQQRLRHTQHV